jgi:hypothetical protein
MVKLTRHQDALTTWVKLNSLLMGSDLATAESLLQLEQSGKRRQQFLLRIHSRINKLRAVAERKALLARKVVAK